MYLFSQILPHLSLSQDILQAQYLCFTIFNLFDSLGKGKEEGKDQESIQSITTRDPRHHMGKRR